MTPDEQHPLYSTQRLKPRHKALILGSLGLKLSEGIILCPFFFLLVKHFMPTNENKFFHSLSKMQLAVYNCEKWTQPKCTTSRRMVMEIATIVREITMQPLEIYKKIFSKMRKRS